VDLQKGEVFTLEELLTAAAIKSANDAAYQIAEFIGNGDAKNFIQMMNEYAAFLNMENTIYYNANGLPGKVSSLDNSSTAEDMAKLCYVFCQYPYLMQLVSQ